jgi:hypothetical protein
MTKRGKITDILNGHRIVELDHEIAKTRGARYLGFIGGTHCYSLTDAATKSLRTQGYDLSILEALND